MASMRILVVWLCASLSLAVRVDTKQKALLNLAAEQKGSAFQVSSELSHSSESLSTHLAALIASLRNAFLRRQRLHKSGTSHAGNTKDEVRQNTASSVSSHILIFWIGVVLLVIVFLIILFLVSTSCWVGRAAKTAIESLDKKLLGVDVFVDSISVNPFSARIEIKGMKVANPIGYQEAYMLEIDTLLLDLDSCSLMCSSLKHAFSGAPIQVVVSQFVFVKFQAMVEKHIAYTSNVKEVLHHLTELRQRKNTPEDPVKITTGVAPESLAIENSAQTKSKTKKLKAKPQIMIRELKIQDIDLRFQVEGKIFGQNLQSGVDITVADVDYKDFCKDHGSYVADDIAFLVLETVLKMIITNIGGREVGSHYF